MSEATAGSSKGITIIRWTARILGTFMAVGFFILFIPEFIRKGGMPTSSTMQIVTVVLFIIGQIGILMAWRWEGRGIVVALVGIVSAGVTSFMGGAARKPGSVLLWLVPIFLFIICWWRSRKKEAKKE